jgi:hypothetical protein
MGINFTSQMVHYSASQKDHPYHNKHVEINLSKMTKWFFWRLSKLGLFLLNLLVKKPWYYNSDKEQDYKIINIKRATMVNYWLWQRKDHNNDDRYEDKIIKIMKTIMGKCQL